ncbi:hypothetical protein CISIN_1g0405921mg, partial [Citrus sinensis]
MPHHSFN